MRLVFGKVLLNEKLQEVQVDLIAEEVSDFVVLRRRVCQVWFSCR